MNKGEKTYMKITSKISAVGLGAVLGLDISIILTGTTLIAPENIIALLAVMVIILEFFDDCVARQICRFSVAIIAGIVVRSYNQMSMVICLMASVITIVIVVLVMAIKGIKRAREEELDEDVE